MFLDDVSLVIRPHEFVCLLGPTGSGKSTLLAALTARVPANQGQVLINQSNLYEHFESLKRDIAVVPQRDILHDELPLVDALRYTAKLRLPMDTSAMEMNAQVDDLLQRVGLQAHRQTRLGQLSGGQRRRSSLANELISNPSLLFLDEVTSGLDEQTDREMMRLFRRLADAGKTVVCVTHTLANIAETCHLVVLLTVGGKLAFVGTPAEALGYFQIERLADVYEKLERSDEADEWRRRFAPSPLFGKYVSSRLSTCSVVERSQMTRAIQSWFATWETVRHQLPLLAWRYWQVFRADRRAVSCWLPRGTLGNSAGAFSSRVALAHETFPGVASGGSSNGRRRVRALLSIRQRLLDRTSQRVLRPVPRRFVRLEPPPSCLGRNAAGHYERSRVPGRSVVLRRHARHSGVRCGCRHTPPQMREGIDVVILNH